MSNVYDKSPKTTRRYRYDQRQRLATSGTSAVSAEIAAQEVLLHATAAMHFTVGASNVTAIESGAGANTIPLEAGEKFHLLIEPGQFVAAIQASAAGVLYIVPVDGQLY